MLHWPKCLPGALGGGALSGPPLRPVKLVDVSRKVGEGEELDSGSQNFKSRFCVLRIPFKRRFNSICFKNRLQRPEYESR